MNIKSLLLGSAAILVVATGARAADPIIIAEPEPVEYVRVCDTYGSGYFYIPGTETCLRVHGYVRAAITAGDDVYADTIGGIKQDTYDWMTRAHLRLSANSETELGTLRSYIDARFQWGNGWGDSRDAGSTGTIRNAWIELGGLRVGLSDTNFTEWVGGYGTVYNDDILTGANKRTNFISYTINGGNGFSAMLAVEQGNNSSSGSWNHSVHRNNDPAAAVVFGSTLGVDPLGSSQNLRSRIDKYTPNFVGGVRYEQGWGGISAVAAYDAYYKEWAGKVRLDVNATDQLSLFTMFGYKSHKDYVRLDLGYGTSGYHATRNDYGVFRTNASMYGDWAGDWIVWAGGQYRFNDDRTSFNLQVSYDDWENVAIAANIEHQIVSGLRITAELDYVNWGNGYGFKPTYAGGVLQTAGVRSSLSDKDAFSATVVLQRSF